MARRACIDGWDGLFNDVEPARRLGLPVYWIDHQAGPAPNGRSRPTTAGELSGLLAWLDSIDPQSLIPAYDTPEAMLAILRSTPAALQAMVSGLASNSWIDKPRPGEWNLAEVVCHLRDVDGEVNLPPHRVLTGNLHRRCRQRSMGRGAAILLPERPQAMQDFIDNRLALLDLLEKPARLIGATDAPCHFGPSQFIGWYASSPAMTAAHCQVPDTLGASRHASF
jgi:hypothetical protein